MDKILVAYDHSEAAQAALSWAIDYSKSRDTEVLLVYVVSSVAEWELAAVQLDPDPIRHNVERLLGGAWSAPLRESGVQFDTRVLVGRPAETILQCAQEEDVSLIALGMTTHGTLFELIVGGVAAHVLHHARRPVVAVPAGWAPEHTEAS
jgi:nucleotide-binding universal stress UspA family protein